MPEYVGINNTARKIIKKYSNADNLTREIKKEYVGVNNVAREIFGRDLGENKWIVVSTNNINGINFNAKDTEYSAISDCDIYSSAKTKINIELKSSIKFYTGDVFNITFYITTEQNNSDAFGQSASMEVSNSNDNSNKVYLNGTSPLTKNECSIYKSDLTLTQDGYLKVIFTLESCGNQFFSVKTKISINNVTL